jgi:hypothetical protein
MTPRVAILARLTSSPAMRRAGRATKDIWKRLLFWPLNAARKDRFDTLGIARGADLSTAHLRLAGTCPCKPKSNFVPLTLAEVSGMARAGRRTTARRFAPTAAVIDLDAFATFDDWRAQVSKRTSGKYHRSANKARRNGYTARIVGKDSYARSLYALTGSKLRRSKGLFVWAAIAGPWDGLVDTGAPPMTPACPWHWRTCWGAFRKTETGEELAAFAILIRAGDTVWVQRFIGHGAALTDGVTKLLMFDIMSWLLSRNEPATAAVRHLIHGSIEEGGIGLFDWKRYLGFLPAVIEVR